MTTNMSGLINDLNKAIKTKSCQSVWLVIAVDVKVDILVTNKTNMSWEFVYVVKVRQLFSKHSQ